MACKEYGSHHVVLPAPGCSLLRQAASATQPTAQCLFSKPQPCSAPPDAAEPTDSSKSPSEIPVSTPDAAERLREAWRAYSQRRRWRTFRGLIESDYYNCCKPASLEKAGALNANTTTTATNSVSAALAIASYCTGRLWPPCALLASMPVMESALTFGPQKI